MNFTVDKPTRRKMASADCRRPQQRRHLRIYRWVLNVQRYGVSLHRLHQPISFAVNLACYARACRNHMTLPKLCMKALIDRSAPTACSIRSTSDGVASQVYERHLVTRQGRSLLVSSRLVSRTANRTFCSFSMMWQWPGVDTAPDT